MAVDIIAAEHDLDARIGAGAGEDPPFALKAGDREDHHIPQATRWLLARRRLR
jgi:hypothetical protein